MAYRSSLTRIIANLESMIERARAAGDHEHAERLEEILEKRKRGDNS